MQKVVKFRNWISLSETFEWVDSLMETIKLFLFAFVILSIPFWFTGLENDFNESENKSGRNNLKIRETKTIKFFSKNSSILLQMLFTQIGQ
jgi:hypothetical protein